MATSKKSNNILERSLINNKKVYENQLIHVLNYCDGHPKLCNLIIVLIITYLSIQ